MRRSRFIQFLIISLVFIVILPTTPDTHAWPASGTVYWANLLCKFSDIPAEPFSASAVTMQFATTKPGVAHYWMQQSNGNLSFDVGTHGWDTLPHPRAYYESLGDVQGKQALVQDCISAGQHGIPVSYEHVIIVNAPTTLSDSKYGAPILNPSDVTTFHRLIAISGDVMDFPRSSGLTPTAANPWDSLSLLDSRCVNACSIPHVLADLKARQGWTTAKAAYTDDQSVSYTLTYLHLAAQSGTYHLVTTPIINGSHYFTIEARHTDENYGLPPFNGGQLVIHRVEDSGKATLLITMQYAQDSYLLPDNETLITITGTSSNGFTITVAPRVTETETSVPTAKPDPTSVGTQTPIPPPTATPDPFTVQLLSNGSFEQFNLRGVPLGWTPSKLTNDLVVCNTATVARADDGVCAFRFQGSAGESSMIWQRIPLTHITGKDELNVSMRSRSNNLQTGAVLQITVHYANAAQRPDTLVLRTGPGHSKYRSSKAMLELAGQPAYADIKLNYKGQKGIVLVDNIQITLR